MTRQLKRNASTSNALKIGGALLGGIAIGTALASARYAFNARKEWLFHLQPADGQYYVNIMAPDQSYTLGPYADSTTAWEEALSFVKQNGGNAVWAGGVR